MKESINPFKELLPDIRPLDDSADRVLHKLNRLQTLASVLRLFTVDFLATGFSMLGPGVLQPGTPPDEPGHE